MADADKTKSIQTEKGVAVAQKSTEVYTILAAGKDKKTIINYIEVLDKFNLLVK